MDTYFQEMLHLRDQLAAIAPISNLPNVNPVYLRRKINQGHETERITPDPWVEDVNFELKNVGDLQALRGMSRVLTIKGVSLVYPRSVLQAQNLIYEIHRGDEILITRLVQIKDMGLTWDITVEQRIGEQNLYGYST